MGKNVSQASLKITKQNHETKRQLNSLIRGLKPKVYITDTSNFKDLVQQLTGNGIGTNKMQFPSPQTRPAAETELEDANVPVIDYIVEDDGDRQCQSSMEAYSFDASVDSFEFCSNELLSSFTEGFPEADNQISLKDATFDMLSTSQAGTEWPSYQDLESWLLDIDHQPFTSFNGYEQNQEVSIYDYELFGLT